MKKLVIFLLLIISLPSFSQNGWRNGEMEIKVQFASAEEADRFHHFNVDAEQAGPGSVYAYVTPSELQKIAAEGFSYQILIQNLNEHYAGFWQNRVPNGFMTYEEIIALADSLSTNFPAICKKVLFGTSMGGRELGALKISDNVNLDEPEAAIMFDGGIHGDELMGPEIVIRYARDLCLGYGSDPVFTDLVNGHEIWLYYMVNPDGRVGMTRYNNNNVDCNRDAGYMWNAEGNSTGAFSQVESRALRDCMLKCNPVVYTNYHAGDEVISYPWSYRTDACPDKYHINQLASVYSQSSGYANLPYGQGYNIMYAINGSNKDFQYGSLGNVGWSIEVSMDKQPPASQLIPYYLKNKPAMTAVIQRCGFGAEGVVTDSITGTPVSATIWIDDFYPVFTRPQVGDYHKYLVSGVYTMKVMASGYQTRTFSISVPSTGSVVTNVKMVRQTGEYALQLMSNRIPLNSFSGFLNAAYTPGIAGSPDDVYFSLWRNGWIVLDMGDTIYNGQGNDFIVHEGTATPEGFSCYSGISKDGPWVLVGTGTGTTSFDLQSAAGGAVSKTRYLKITDDGDGPSTGVDLGFDLDAVEMITQPLLSDFIVSDLDACTGENLSFTDYSRGTPATWEWSFPGATPSSSSQQNPQDIVYSAPGTYPVSLKVTNSYCTNIRTKTAFVTVEDFPVVDLGNDTSTLVSQSLELHAGNPGCSYEWSTGATTESIVADTAGHGPGTFTYWVNTTTPGGCMTSDTIKISFTWPAGEPGEEDDDDLVKVYPNPADDVLQIDLSGTEPGKLLLINVHGETVLEQEVAPGHDEIDVSNFKSGLYMLELTVTGKRSTRKIVLR